MSDEDGIIAKIEELENQLVEAQKITKYLSEQNATKQNQLDQIHSILDLVPNPPPRKSPIVEGQPAWEQITYSATSRLAGWMAWVGIGE